MSLSGIDHKSFAILPRTLCGVEPSMLYTEAREDWERVAAFESILLYPQTMGDAAADLFDCWMFGA